MSITEEEILAGQAVYTPRALKAYDLIVLGLSNRLIWRCPTPRLLAHYDSHVSANHLDVGVGTGYFLEKCRYPSPTPRIALMDLNLDVLDFATRRLTRFQPVAYQANVLAPIRWEAAKFDSVGLGYLLHCLPGTMASKSVAFDHLKALINPGAMLFGATLLQGGVQSSGCARRLMDFYNRKGIFSNQADDLEALTTALRERFKEVRIEVVGCAALFSGRA